jgi:hypothetical protein
MWSSAALLRMPHMEKAKRKHSPEIAQKQVTRMLLLILGLSIVILFFPLVWMESPIKPPFQTYTLVPLLSIPILMFYGTRFGFRKRDFVLLGFCLYVATLIFTNFVPCPLHCHYPEPSGIVIRNIHCSGVFLYCLF